ncbi:MAG: hypothetical protein SXA11_09475 [Cyanobacteriota bacterium]|nr:hypothetical protein [Cyanobacteriota bacterium]
MKGYIKGKSIILVDSLPEEVKDGDEVNVSFSVIQKRKYSFSTFNLGVKDEYTRREKIYESD